MMITLTELLERAETEEIAIHTPTEEQAKTLLKALDEKGYTWFVGQKLTDITCYEVFGQDTCYVFGCYNLGLSKKVMYRSLDFYRDEGYTIIECGDIDFKEE
jgi:cytolysin (calcineurin-like family phosphatase)